LKSPDIESDTSESEPDEDGTSKESSKSSLPNSDIPMTNVPILEISDLSVSPTDATAPFAPPTIPRPSITTAPPRYILRKAYKRMKLQHPLPPIMILHLKRFYGAYSGSMKKLDDFVSFETEFDFGPFVVSFDRRRNPPRLY
jgi:hypothetical protein